ncbi:MAG: ADP-ribose pyrophosphatase [Oceanicoccus sp.]|jgi:ADP-ribose pyrophosphatase
MADSPLDTPPIFSRADVELLDDNSAYQGFFQIRCLKLRHRLFQGGWSDTIKRELFKRHDAVGVLLVDPKLQAVALIEQFRVGMYGSKHGEQQQHSPWSLELVAGLIDKDEVPAEVAARESEEEAGTVIKALAPIAEFYSSPGGSNEYFYLFAGLADLSTAGGIHGLVEEGEDIRVHVVTLPVLWQLLEQGKLNNAHTLIAVQWLKMHYLSLQQRWL